MAFRSHTTQSAPEPETVSPDDKWLLASHLQKSVRRGLADEAAWALQGLYRLDPTYLRYRLAVIAVEDVAGASPEAVADAFAGGWTKKAVDAAGGVSFLEATARSWAGARKDRTPCTWSAASWALPAFEAQQGSWLGLSPEGARRLAWQSDQPWWVRGLAAWRAVGTQRFPCPRLPLVDGDWDAWQVEVADRGASSAQLAALAAGAKQREPHPVFLALAWEAQRQEGAQAQSVAVRDLGKAGPWLSCAVDRHTRNGLAAFRALVRHPSARQWGRERGLDDEALAEAVGRLWFWLEGGQVDLGLAYPTAAAIENGTRQAFLRRAGVNGKELADRFGDGSAVHAARCAAVGAPAPSASRPRP